MWYLSGCNTKEAAGSQELLAKAPTGTRAILQCCKGDTWWRGEKFGIWAIQSSATDALLQAGNSLTQQSKAWNSRLVKLTEGKMYSKAGALHITSKIKCTWIKELTAFVVKY